MINWKTTFAGLSILAMSSPATAQLTNDERAKLENIVASPAKLKEARRLLGLDEKRVRTPARTKGPPTPPVDVVVPPPKPITLLNKNTPAVRNGDAPPGASRFAAPNGAPTELSPCAGLTMLLRQDWKDIDLLSCPETTDKAKGAELSYAHDRIANNELWTARGTAAVSYNSLLDAPGAYYKSFGAYVTVNRALNSAPAAVKGDSDKIAFGGVGELGIQTEGAGTHFFRLRGGAVEDRLKDTSSANITGEWIPVYDRGDIHIHSPYRPFNQTAPFLVQFDPVLLVQYNTITDKNQTISGKNQTLDFNGRTQAFRIGPQFTLRVFPLPDATDFFSRLSADVTYHWAHETFSAKGISWFQSSVTYNIDDAGQFGITASYKKGHDEDTGTLTDIYKLALTGKI